MNGLKINTVRPLINAQALTGGDRLAAAVENEINAANLLERHLSVYRDLSDISQCLQSIIVRREPQKIYVDVGQRLQTLADSLRSSRSQDELATLKNEIKLELGKIPDFILEDIRKAAGLPTPDEIIFKGASDIRGVLSLPIELMKDVLERAAVIWFSVMAKFGGGLSAEEQKMNDEFEEWPAKAYPLAFQPLSNDEVESDERVGRRVRFGMVLRTKGRE